MDRQNISDQIEACRPGSDDLFAPEMTGLAAHVEQDPHWRRCYAQSQELDAALADTFQDVPVPPTLESQILARLSEATNAPHDDCLGEAEVASDLGKRPDVAGAVQPASPVESEHEITKGRNRLIKRRSLLRLSGIAACLTLAAIVVVAGIQMLKKDPIDPWSAHRLADRSLQWRAASIAATDWDKNCDAVLADNPLPRSIRGVPFQWHRGEASGLGDAYIAYDLSRPFEPKWSSLLFVLPGSTNVEHLPSGPPRQPQTSTGRLSAGAWRSGEQIYVLVVNGPKQRYLDEIDIPRELAVLPPFEHKLCAFIKP